MPAAPRAAPRAQHPKQASSSSCGAPKRHAMGWPLLDAVAAAGSTLAAAQVGRVHTRGGTLLGGITRGNKLLRGETHHDRLALLDLVARRLEPGHNLAGGHGGGQGGHEDLRAQTDGRGGWLAGSGGGAARRRRLAGRRWLRLECCRHGKRSAAFRGARAPGCAAGAAVCRKTPGRAPAGRPHARWRRRQVG